MLEIILIIAAALGALMVLYFVLAIFAAKRLSKIMADRVKDFSADPVLKVHQSPRFPRHPYGKER